MRVISGLKLGFIVALPEANMPRPVMRTSGCPTVPVTSTRPSLISGARNARSRSSTVGSGGGIGGRVGCGSTIGTRVMVGMCVGGASRNCAYRPSDAPFRLNENHRNKHATMPSPPLAATQTGTRKRAGL